MPPFRYANRSRGWRWTGDARCPVPPNWYIRYVLAIVAVAVVWAVVSVVVHQAAG